MRYFEVPGRANLVGEHTDYTNGKVLPFALQHRLRVGYEPLSTPTLVLLSELYQEEVEIPLPKLHEVERNSWAHYPIGIVRRLRSNWPFQKGFRLVIGSDIPHGSGVSSSAALLVGTALATLHHAKAATTPEALVRLCQRVEHEDAGVRCGTMDFWAIIEGRAGYALFIDFTAETRELVSLSSLSDLACVLAHSRIHRSLAAGEYNLRRAQTEAISRQLVEMGLPANIGALTVEDLRWVRGLDPVLQRRLEHIVEGNHRVTLTVQALRSGHRDILIRCVNQSHDSLRDKYEVSCPELDSMVRIAREQGRALASRLMGGGFGGCTLNLVPRSEVPQFKQALERGYYQPESLEPFFISAESGDGAQTLAPDLFADPRLAKANPQVLTPAMVERMASGR